MFGNHLKYVIALVILFGFSYSLPQVRESMNRAFTLGESGEVQTAAIVQTAPIAESIAICPVGYTCTPISSMRPPGCPNGYVCTVDSNRIPSITVTKPNGGPGEEPFERGMQYKVFWTTNNIATSSNVTIRVRNVETRQEGLISVVPNTGVGAINIPANFPIGIYNLEVRTSINGQTYMDVSDQPFKIVAATPLTYEQVKCVFDGSSVQQKCYTATDKLELGFGCSGVGACTINVKAPKGTQLSWKSSCGGDKSPITTVDGNNEYAKFTCGPVATPIPSPIATTTMYMISVSNMSASTGPGITDGANGPISRYPVSYSFTLTNNTTNALYVPTSVTSFVKVMTGGASASSTIYSVEYMPSMAGDTDMAYILPATGSRTFTFNGMIAKQNASTTMASMRITSINYFKTSNLSGLKQSITSGLETLYRGVTF